MSKNKNSRSSSSIFSFVITHRKISTVIVTALYIGITIVFCILTPARENESSFTLERIELAAEISSFFFIVVSSVIAVWQYYISSRNEKIRYESEKIQKSIDLAEYYKDNILTKAAAISYIFQQSGIESILKNIDANKMINFDTHEMEQLLSKRDIDKIKAIIQSEEFLIAAMNAKKIFGNKMGASDPSISFEVCSFDFNDTTSHKYEQFSDKEKEAIQNHLIDLVGVFVNQLITDVLNNLEYFSMYFTHNIADDTVIYQSLHQTFLDITEFLYYNISRLNNDGCSKFYVNTIELHNKWRKRKTEKINDSVNKQRDTIDTGNNAVDID